MKIYQFLETFSDGDAIGYHAMGIDRLLKSKNIKTAIYANNIEKKCVKIAKYYKDFKFDEEDNVLLFHHSIGSEVFEYVKNLSSIKKLIFHNITPPSYFRHRPDFMKMLEKGYRQLHEFDRVFTNAICDSEFNKSVLRSYGFKKKIEVIPPFVSLRDKFIISMKAKKPKKFRVLYVSQIAPHKNQKKLVKIFNTYQKYFNSNSELYIVGGYNLQDSYYQELRGETGKNKSIYLTGRISLRKLKSLYQSSDLFLSMSEHEGFSVPLVEAMYFKLPIIAYEAGAVADTLKSGGVLLKSDNPLVVGAIIETIMKNKLIIKKIRLNQSKVMKLYKPLLIEKELLKWLVKN